MGSQEDPLQIAVRTAIKCDSGQRYLIISSVITIAGVAIVPVADLALNNLKTRTSLSAVSTLRGQDHFCHYASRLQ